MLVNAKWVDAGTLAKTWGELVGQEFAIVKVKDARGSDYTTEVCKYICKGSELAAWKARDIFDFIRATSSTRSFFRFGTLFNLPPIKRIRKDPSMCDCGCMNFDYAPDCKTAIAEIRKREPHHATQRTPPADPQLQLVTAGASVNPNHP